MSDWHTDTAKLYKRLSDYLPTLVDADSNGDVLFLRSGIPTLGKWHQRPVDASHWRHTDRYYTDRISVLKDAKRYRKLARLFKYGHISQGCNGYHYDADPIAGDDMEFDDAVDALPEVY